MYSPHRRREARAPERVCGLWGLWPSDAFQCYRAKRIFEKLILKQGMVMANFTLGRSSRGWVKNSCWVNKWLQGEIFPKRPILTDNLVRRWFGLEKNEHNGNLKRTAAQPSTGFFSPPGNKHS